MNGLVRFARDSLGIDLYFGQQQVLNEWAASARRKAVLALGRRSGKGLMAAVAAIYNAVVPDYSRFLRPGEQRFIIVVAVRQEQAREFIRTVREILAAAPPVPQIRADLHRASRRCAADQQRLRFLVFLPGEQGGPRPGAAGKG